MRKPFLLKAFFISAAMVAAAGIAMFGLWESPLLAFAASCPPPSPGVYCIDPFTSSIDALAIICGLATSIRQFSLPVAMFAIIFGLLAGFGEVFPLPVSDI